MAHPEVKVGMRLSFANPSGKRTLLIGEVLAVNGGVARIFDGYRQHYVDTTTARKPACARTSGYGGSTPRRWRATERLARQRT